MQDNGVLDTLSDTEDLPELVMSPIRPAKRRRLETVSQSLSQPFKSPFKTPLKHKPSTETNILSPACSQAKDTPTNQRHSHPKPSPSQITLPPLNIPLRRPPSLEYHSLRHHHTSLLTHLSSLQNLLSTSTQALKIESSSSPHHPRDTDLHALIQKWKIASRAAAEDVFAKAKERVDKMGGVGGMRERERERERRGWGWDVGGKEEGGGRDDGGKKGEEEEEEEGDEDGTGFRGGEYDGDGDGRVKKEEEEEGDKDGGGADDEDEGYTMDMMLRSLNIDLDVIGFDKKAERWVD